MDRVLMSRFVDAAGWTLAHFVWQAVLVGLVLAMGLRVARSRYVAAATGMLTLFVAAAGTFAFCWMAPEAHPAPVQGPVRMRPVTMNEPSPATASPSAAPGERAALPATESPSDTSGTEAASVVSHGPVSPVLTASAPPSVISNSRWCWWVVGVWLCGVIASGVKLWLDWRAVRSLCRRAVSLPFDSPWAVRLAELAERIGVRRSVTLLQSSLINTPAAVGIFKPVIVVPVSMLSGLPPDQVDAILLHELAHLRRHDYLVNLCQALMETVFFFHPVVWWISRTMRVEREHCCDDVAAAACQDVAQYAGALAALEAFRGRLRYRMAPAADGPDGQLLTRVRRLTRRGTADDQSGSWMLPVVVLAALLMCCLTWRGLSASSGTDWSTLQTIHYSESGTDVVCIATPDALHAVIVMEQPSNLLSHSAAAGVNRRGKTDRFDVEALLTWNDSALAIRFESAAPRRLLLNERTVDLSQGRVLYRSAAGDVRQSRWLTAALPGLPEVVARTPDSTVAAVRARVIREFTPPTAQIVTRQGDYQLASDVRLVVRHAPLNGPNHDTHALLHWPADDAHPPRYCRVDIAQDVFGNFEPWAVAWDKGETCFWIATGERSLERPGNPPAVTDLSRVDYSDPDHIVRERFDGVPAENGPSESCLGLLNRRIRMSPMRRHKTTWHYPSVPGEEAPPVWIYNPLDVVASLREDGTFRIGPDPGKQTEDHFRSVRMSRLHSWEKTVAAQPEAFRNAVEQTPPQIRLTLITPPSTPDDTVTRIITAARAAGLWGAAATSVNATTASLDEMTKPPAKPAVEPTDPGTPPAQSPADTTGDSSADATEDSPADPVEDADDISAPVAPAPRGNHPVTVFGRVVDDRTGEVIKTGVRVQGGMFRPGTPEKVSWGYSLTGGGGTPGRFSAQVNWPQGRTARVLVDGYAPAAVLTSAPSAGVKRLEVTLRLKRGRAVSGRVVDHRGTPVVGASVFSIPLVDLNIRDGKAWGPLGNANQHAAPVVTDEKGRFRDLALSAVSAVAVSTPLLDAWPATVAPFQNEVEIQLPAPATVTINYDIPGAPDEVDVFYQMLTPFQTDRVAWKNLHPNQVLTIRRGQTNLKTLAPGRYQILRRRLIDMGSVGHYASMGWEYFEVAAGGVHTINWTRNEGARVKAQLNWPKDVPVAGIMYSVVGKPSKDFGGLDVPNSLDGGPVDLKTGLLQTALIPPGEYTLNISVQKPVSEERQRISAPILPNYIDSIRITIPDGVEEVVLDDIGINLK